MMSYDFQTVTYGKWILAGEHAVLRGGAALVFPINEKKLTLGFRKSNQTLDVHHEGEHGTDMHVLLWSVLEHGMQILGEPLSHLKGQFFIQNNIPVGGGMGASAALCVAMARWFAAQNILPDLDIHSFARELENLFHGKSSGLDITGVAATSGVYFKHGIHSSIKQTWSPTWFLSSCGEMGITSYCIKQVRSIWQENSEEAALIDKQMSESVAVALSALEQKYTPESQRVLAQAISIAADCFSRWGLISERLRQHMKKLHDAGALAVKPTGSGGGGYVLSLWEKAPPKLALDLISL